ncbi:pentapeptide repeat-containing protein [Thalassobius sp. I31.1]|uniref:pentapeptide repeat-containing protein n=1 Tax=Thalassobius sp. I31.1 TaxID=2109912 RepID=UPI000D19A953|nr:pentapeptide repeat-containing protein [Thalassobius sp. I31.1]
MAEKKNDLMEWLGFANPPKFVNAPLFGKILGFLISVLCFVLVGLMLLIIAKFTAAAISGDFTENDSGARALRELGTVILALFGAPFLIWRTVIASKQAHTAEQGLYTDRIAKAVEQIGADKVVKRHVRDYSGSPVYETKAQPQQPQDISIGMPPLASERFFEHRSDIPELDRSKPVYTEETAPNLEVRIGGLLALERIARDSLDDHITVMEIICAYVRENSPVRSLQPKKAPFRRKNPRSDIQIAISILGRRSPSQVSIEAARKFRIDLRSCDLDGLMFEGGDFSGGLFSDSRIESSFMRNCNLEGAIFINSLIHATEFYGAILDGARFDDSEIADIQRFSNPFSAKSFKGICLFGAKLSGNINLTPKKLSHTIGNGNTILPKIMTPGRDHAIEITEQLEEATYNEDAGQIERLTARLSGSGYENWTNFENGDLYNQEQLREMHKRLNVSYWPHNE